MIKFLFIVLILGLAIYGGVTLIDDVEEKSVESFGDKFRESKVNDIIFETSPLKALPEYSKDFDGVSHG